MDDEEKQRLAIELMPKIERLVRRMTKHCLYLRDESLSAAYLGLARELNEFDSQKSDNFGAFAMQAARAHVLNFMRIRLKEKNNMQSYEVLPSDIFEAAVLDMEPVGWEVDYQDFVERLAKPMYGNIKKVFLASYLDCRGADRKSAAAYLGLSQDNVTSSHMRAITRARRYLGLIPFRNFI